MVTKRKKVQASSHTEAIKIAKGKRYKKWSVMEIRPTHYVVTLLSPDPLLKNRIVKNRRKK